MHLALGNPWPAGIAAISALAYVLCDLLHEFAHLGVARWLGVEVVAMSTIGVSSLGDSALVAAAGPVANLALGTALWPARRDALGAPARYAAWLFGSINLFNGTAYLLYSALLGGGDWAAVLGAWWPGSLWRPLAGVVGALLYAVAAGVSARGLQGLVAAGVFDAFSAARCCRLSYGVGGTVLVLGSLFNPVSPWFIVASGAATGFGAMVALLWLPSRLRAAPASGAPIGWRVGWPWMLAGAVATVVFVGVFGPGLKIGD